MNNNAEIYLIAGVIASIGCAMLADIWPGFITNLHFYRLSMAIPIGTFLFAWHISKQDYNVSLEEQTKLPEEFPSPEMQNQIRKQVNRVA